MTAETLMPGQAFRDTLIERWTARGRWVDMRSYDELPEDDREDLEAAAQAAIAAAAPTGQPEHAEVDDQGAAAAQEPRTVEVRLGPCETEGHDGEHIQWNSYGHRLCGQLVANALGAQGIFADHPETERPASELAAQNACLRRQLDAATASARHRAEVDNPRKDS